jgi:hypothetical protein
MDAQDTKYIILALCCVIVVIIAAIIFIVSRKTKVDHKPDRAVEPMKESSVKTPTVISQSSGVSEESTTKVVKNSVEPTEPVKKPDTPVTTNKPSDPNGVLTKTSIHKEINCVLVANMYYIINRLIHLKYINKYGNVIENGDVILRSCITQVYDKLLNIMDSANKDYQEQEHEHNDRIEDETQLYCNLMNTAYVKEQVEDIEDLYKISLPAFNVIQSIFENIKERAKAINECKEIYERLSTLTIRQPSIKG